MIPVTVAQVLNATQEDDRFLSGNIELQQVTIVGLVRSVNETPTRLDYFIDDMTGSPIEVRQFVDNDENTPEPEKTQPMRENTYVRVIGHVRAFQGKRNLVAFKLLPIEDMNELTSHMLEVIKAHIMLSRGQMGGAQTSAAAGSSTSMGGDGMYSGMQPDQGLSSIQKQVQMILASCQDETGYTISYICEKLRGYPANAVREAVDFLSSEGHVYSTVDDEHFKSTMSN